MRVHPKQDCLTNISRFMMNQLKNYSLAEIKKSGAEIKSQEYHFLDKLFNTKKHDINDKQTSMNISNVPAWLSNTLESTDNDKTICKGSFCLEKGERLIYEESKLLLMANSSFLIRPLKK